jgi:hypothetical protein
LHISTSDGNQYESEPSTMSYVPDIDSIYYAKEAKLVNNATATEVGLSIFLDTKKGLTDNNYYRWDFEETWKFKVPNATKFDYINDSTIIPIKQVKDIGWKSSKNDQVILHSVLNGSDRIVKEPIQFIVAKTSDRLTLEYSILVRQYSISKSEYEFWNSMIKVNNSGADIFASQPFPVMSNIHNIKNPAEMVLGYFGVSAVKQKRMFISYSEIIALDLPFYHYPCERIERSPADYSPPWGNPPTWDDVYNMFIYAKYAFVEPVYDPVTLRLKKLVFAKPSCADSEVTGTSIKPDFWIDLD